MNENDRQANIELLEESITEHEHAISTLHEKLSDLYEEEQQDNIKLFIERTGLTISYGDELNVTAQFDEYAKSFLTNKGRHEDFDLWNQRKEGALTIYNYELDDDLNAIIDAKWNEVEYRKVGGHYFQNGIARWPLHSIPFRNIPIEIIKSCIKNIEENES